jgi:hypothetical protein
MPQHSKENILAGRSAVDTYRADHAKLYDKPWHRGIPEEHTPLLNNLLADLKGRGFTLLDEFFDASEELNIQELGFADKKDFETKATEADLQTLDGMWH